MDSLLGIGLGSSKEEGKALAVRLTEMRNERNTRAKDTAAIKTSTAAKVAGGKSPGQLGGIVDINMDNNDGIQMITPPGSDSSKRSSKSKSKNKKKKKKVKR